MGSKASGNAVGTVISTPESPSSVRFDFVVNGDIKVRKGQFVQTGRLIARVDEVYKTNRYFERAESVSEYERSGGMKNMFPIEKWECLVARAAVLGAFASDKVQRPSFPPSPGDMVEPAAKDRLVKFLGLDMEKGVDIGVLEHQDVMARLNMTRLLQKHLAILAMSGAGKSYAASVIFEELLDRKKEDGQMAIIVIDPHGEYASFADDPKYAKKVRVVRGSEVSVGINSFTGGMFAKFMPDMKESSKRALNRVLSSLRKKYREKGGFGIDEILSLVKDDESIRTQTKNTLVDMLEEMQRLKVLGRNSYPSHGDLKQGRMLVLDLSDVLSLRKKQMIVAGLASDLFMARQMGWVPPFTLAVEEAHNFTSSTYRTFSNSIIERIAREGRKFYASLCLISQRPVYLSVTALSQCNTHIIMRVMNPDDLRRIRESSEGLSEDAARSIPGLRTGEAIIVGSAMNYPAFVRIRKRRSKEPSHSKTLEQYSVAYSKGEEKEKEDVDAFM